jgi:hypothetical protein
MAAPPPQPVIGYSQLPGTHVIVRRLFKIIAVLGLVVLLAGWFVVQSGKFARRPNSLAISPELAKPQSHPPGSASIPREITAAMTKWEATPTRSTVPGEPFVESSWAKELRELKELAAKDPAAALARVAKMPDKHELKSAAVGVCRIVAEKDPALAMNAAWEFGLGKFAHEETENTALEILAEKWGEADIAKALAWASTLPADDEWRRDRVVKGIALAVAKISPAEAARMVAEKIDPESSVQVDAAIGVLREWASREYSGAVAWASLFPAGPLRERSLEELASADPNAPHVP